MDNIQKQIIHMYECYIGWIYRAIAAAVCTPTGLLMLDLVAQSASSQ